VVSKIKIKESLWESRMRENRTWEKLAALYLLINHKTSHGRVLKLTKTDCKWKVSSFIVLGTEQTKREVIFMGGINKVPSKW